MAWKPLTSWDTWDIVYPSWTYPLWNTAENWFQGGWVFVIGGGMKFVAGESEILWDKTIKLYQAPSRGRTVPLYSKNADSWEIQYIKVGIPCPSWEWYPISQASESYCTVLFCTAKNVDWWCIKGALKDHRKPGIPSSSPRHGTATWSDASNRPSPERWKAGSPFAWAKVERCSRHVTRMYIIDMI